MGSIRKTVASGLVTSRVLMVRHGQSTWNALGRWQGQADPPLSPLGHAQARAAVASVGAVDLVVASDLERARVTAEIMAEGLGVGPAAVDSRLREIDAGPWSGLTRAEIEAGWPRWLAEGRRPEGFEGNDAVARRATEAVLALHAVAPGGSVL